MNEMRVARGLGWFSIGLGVAEIVAGRELGRALGLEDKEWLIRAFGVREIASGVAILATDNPRAAVWSRVAGDVLDLAVLGSGFTEDNPKKGNLALAFANVAGITALDYWCARRLGSARPHGSIATHRANVADGSAPHYRDAEMPASR
ncbi:hypothetical protein TA3x_005706 (plasmid) [Tundrisphaera sp. TA3]|uniref:hypothetical protein n=1 Tax=Tundrisphaera sp. TA3 TaxID=3435775 RepID=UPI003EB7EFA2